jgi:hypothetical protein
VAFYGQRTRFMLHRKVIPHRTRAITNEIKRGRKASTLKELVKKVIEGALSRADPSGWRDTALLD